MARAEHLLDGAATPPSLHSLLEAIEAGALEGAAKAREDREDGGER